MWGNKGNEKWIKFMETIECLAKYPVSRDWVQQNLEN